ncbi:MAG TPA: cellulosomal protein, partial [Candidatus Handelsmanbacteria bacterium]|nr:cellulosomal protein [Candidatus Handelsmanbacteria bacterium]
TLRATVTVDGQSYEDVAVRKKGFLGSLSATRPSLKVNFGKFVQDRTHADMKRMTLNNNLQDASNTHQCMAYELFAKAGLVAPRCNFAKVSVNGEDLGIYTHVESVKKPMLRRHFDDDDGNLYEGQGGDFVAHRLEMMELKTNERQNDRSDLDDVAAALLVDDDELLEAVGAYVDIDSFLSFWAMEVMTGHWDSYTGGRNNYLTYHDPTTDRFFFIPWGTDGAFSGLRVFSGDNRNAAVLAEGEIANRLYGLPETRAMYFERLDELFSEVWDEQELLAEVDRIEVLTGTASSGTQSQRDFITSHSADLRAALDDRENAGEWIRSPGADEEPECRPELVTPVSGSFSTAWADTLMPSPAGDQSLDIVINGEPWQPSSLMSGAGSDSQDPNIASILLVSLGAGGRVSGLVVRMPKQHVVAGEHAMHGMETNAIFVELDPSDPSSTRILGFVGNGSITLEQASTEAGAPVVGHFEGEFVQTAEL